MDKKTAIRIPESLLAAAEDMQIVVRERTGIKYSRSQILIKLIELGLTRISDTEGGKYLTNIQSF